MQFSCWAGTDVNPGNFEDSANCREFPLLPIGFRALNEDWQRDIQGLRGEAHAFVKSSRIDPTRRKVIRYGRPAQF
jgi:hypothetical protein